MAIEKQQGSSSTYSTSDIYLSAFLKAKGMRLQDKRQIGNKCHFIFQDRQDRELLIQDFFNDGLVSITTFKIQLHILQGNNYGVFEKLLCNPYSSIKIIISIFFWIAYCY